MPQTIHILPPALADKIAAGEVVQRPASVVKELLENSIDAGARSVSVLLKDGGRTLIQVIDDGSGMSREDAAVAFMRHATSKIASYEDLENIRTLGFRGEALASVAAVSQVELRTRRSSDEVGWRIRIEGGAPADAGEEAAAPGTSIAVRNLFYNTPARRNFLKSDATEYKHVVDVVQRIALSHPGLAVTFTSDDETILRLSAGDHAARIGGIFGDALAGAVLPFRESAGPISMAGFLGRPAFARKSRIEQYIFLNGRSIVNRGISHAVFKAYEHLLEKSSFPFFVLFLTLDPRKVDVNVHPSKMEVKFDDESFIYRFVLSSVRKALSGQDLLPQSGIPEGLPDRLQPPGDSAAGKGRVADWRELLRGEVMPQPAQDTGESSDGSVAEQPPRFLAAKSGATAEQSGLPSLPAASSLPVWQIHNKYILAPVEGGVMMIDQHAAHERVLYERAVARFNGARAATQELMFPVTVEFTPQECALVGQLLPLLRQLGFGVRMFGKTGVVVDGVPSDVRPGDEQAILRGVLDLYREDDQSVRLEPRERLAKSFSCKAAIKAGDPLKQMEIYSLLDQLFATEIPYVCPHGRPVIVHLSLSELDRRFGRTS